MTVAESEVTLPNTDQELPIPLASSLGDLRSGAGAAHGPDGRKTEVRRKSAGEVARLKATSRQMREMARVSREAGDTSAANFEQSCADRMDVSANDGANTGIQAANSRIAGHGAELKRVLRGKLQSRSRVVDTVTPRDGMLAADATVQRLDLAQDAKVLTLAVEAAETIQPQNSLEHMLAHQMAAAHAMAMRFAGRAGQFLDMTNDHWDPVGNEARCVEAARMAATSARLMDGFTRGLLALERLRHGGQQVVTVQHVTVADGGKAVVTGAVLAE